MPEKNHNCPQCKSAHSYNDGNLWVCPECFHEWTPEVVAKDNQEQLIETNFFIDSNGVPLENGDTVATVKELKIGNDTIKSGTKAKNIRLLNDPVDGHDISCKLPGHGSIYLKCSVVKKLK